jgi:hypothetical protein
MSDQAATLTLAAPPGNPSKQTLEQHAAHLRAAFVRAITRDDLCAISRKLTEQARERNRTSARLLLKYGLGDATLLQTDLALHWEAKDNATTVRKVAGEPTNEEILAQVHAKMREQAALEAEMRGRSAPAKPGDARPGTPAATRSKPPGSAGR